MIGKVAIITGATAGIGEATAKRFAREGIRVVLAGRREALSQRLVESIRAEGGEGTFVAADMLSEDDVRRVVDTAVNHYGRLDYAVNNAGIPGEVEPLHELSRNNWDNVIGVNLTGVFLCLKYQVAAMLESGAREPGGAAIVNVASSIGHRASPLSSAAYTASKHGVVGLTRQAAVEYVQRNIRVNAVCPGATRTELLSQLMTMGPEVEAQLNSINPIGRLIEVDEVAAAALFLCSPGASGITGHTLPVEGGQLAKL